MALARTDAGRRALRYVATSGIGVVSTQLTLAILQFVLELKEEEPLDLLDLLIADFRRHPGHWLDRLVSPLGRNKFCARRLFLKLPRSNSFAPLWIREAEAILASHFH